jgi:hypothetical protein
MSKSTTIPKPVVCAKCNQEFQTVTALEVHWPKCTSKPEETLFTCPECGRGGFTNAGLMRHVCKPTKETTELAVVPDLSPAEGETAYEQMGAQLTDQYRKAVEGMRAVVRFGAMLMQVQDELETGPRVGQFSGGRGKEGGLREWLRTYATDVPYATACRYLAVAEAVREVCNLPASIKQDPAKFAAFVQASPEALEEKLQAKQLTLWEEVDGSSQRSWMDRLKARKTPGGKTHRKHQEDPGDPNDPAAEARDIWTPIGKELETEGLVEKSWKDLDDADMAGLFRIVADLYKELKAATSSTPSR